MILEIAIGDAYGAPFEFASTEFIEKFNDLQGYKTRKTKWGTVAGGGKYTDDTAMSIAIAEHILDGRDLTPRLFFESFVKHYHRDIPRQGRAGYSKRMVERFDLCMKAGQITDKIMADSQVPASSNGAVMRSVPLGLLRREDLDRAVIAQTLCTHAHVDAIRASHVIALAAHYLIYDLCSLDQLATVLVLEGDVSNLINGYVPKGVNENPIDCDAVQTVQAVFYLLFNKKKQSEILQEAINMGGDVDSVASIALGLASLTDEIEADLDSIDEDASLLLDLESASRYGRVFITDLDRRIDTYIKSNWEEVQNEIKEEENAETEMAESNDSTDTGSN